VQSRVPIAFVKNSDLSDLKTFEARQGYTVLNRYHSPRSVRDIFPIHAGMRIRAGMIIIGQNFGREKRICLSRRYWLPNQLQLLLARDKTICTGFNHVGSANMFLLAYSRSCRVWAVSQTEKHE
jgi:hypothetical protein